MFSSENISLIPQLISNSLITGSIYALAAVGLALTYGAYRILNFAHGHTIMLGGYIFYSFYVLLEFNVLFAIFSSILIAISVGIFFLNFFIKPFIKINTILAFVTTLALSIMLESIISIVYGVNVLSYSSVFSTPIQIFTAFITSNQIIIVLTTVILMLSLWLFIKFSISGLRLKALTESSEYLASIGVNSGLLSGCSYVLGVIFAFLAGISLGFETNLQPTMGTSLMLKSFAAVVVGGLGNPRGAIVGAYLLAFIENFSIGLDFGGYSLPASYRDSFAFVIILLVLLFKPQGLLLSKVRSA